MPTAPINPSFDFKRQANLQEAEYQQLLEQYQTNPEEFWSQLARKNIYWHEDFTQVFDYTNKPFFEWFAGGRTNISYNCLDRHLPNHGTKTAIIYESEDGLIETITYKDLHKQVCQMANYLKRIGVKQNDAVCIYMPLTPEAIIAMQACTRIGAVHSVVFAGFSAHALRDRIIDLKARFIITADGLLRKGEVVKLLQTVSEAIHEINTISRVICFDRLAKCRNKNQAYQEELTKIKHNLGERLHSWNLIKAEDEHCEPSWQESEATSFVLYTSGSTGKPKGLKHSTAGYLLWAHLTSKWVFDLKDSDIYWCTADIGWITGHTYVCYGPLANAATIFIYEGAPNYPDKNRFWSMIEKHKITIFYTAPTAVRAFMQWGFEDKHDLSSLRLLGSVGEPINPSAWEWFYENIGKNKCPIVDTWWQTETGGIMITTLPGINAMKPGSAGLPLPGVETKLIYDNDHREAGILYLSKALPSMARGIHGDDTRYKQTYWSNPHGYLAGDAASEDDESYIHIAGRIDDVINVSGHRLGTAEIESALVAHELISEAAVVSIPHEIKGEGIVAFVVVRHPEGGQSPTVRIQNYNNIEEEFKSQVVQEIGAIARPEKIIITKSLPKTRSGKIMRRLLKDIAQGKRPQGDISTLENSQALEELL